MLLMTRRPAAMLAASVECALCHQRRTPDEMRGEACAWCIHLAGCATCGATCLVGTMSNGPRGYKVCRTCARYDD
jgi:hypothetical protein